MDILFGVFFLLTGLIFGSFANVVIWRLPRGESIVSPPSHCPQCGTRLTARDLVPLLSYLFLRGRCRHCGKPVSLRYPTVELICGLLFAVCYLAFGVTMFPNLCLVFVLLCITYIDLDYQIIPDSLLIFGGIVGVLWVAASNIWQLPGVSWADALIGVLVGSFPLLLIDLLGRLIFKKEGMGLGDVKLMAMVGLYLGWQYTLIALLFGIMLGGLVGLLLLLLQRVERGSYIPFGPFLAIGSLVALFWGPIILNWYVGLFM